MCGDGPGSCENTLGSYKCVCPAGYRGNGTHCEGSALALASGFSMCNLAPRGRWEPSVACWLSASPSGTFSYLQTRTNALRAVTGATPTLAAATSSARTSASATKASTEMGALASVGERVACSVEHANTWAQTTSPKEPSLFTDVDECAVNNARCQHNCSNESGGYSCRCAPGFRLDQDGHNCTGKAKTPRLWGVDVTGGQRECLHRSTHRQRAWPSLPEPDPPCRVFRRGGSLWFFNSCADTKVSRRCAGEIIQFH